MAAPGHSAEVAAGERFEFGANWARFLGVLNDERIAEAEASLRAMLERDDLHGLSFLDIGSGSGLFSLAAMKLFVPSVSTAPTGMPLTTSDCTLLLWPGRLFTVAVIAPSAVALPSMPLSTCGSHVTVGGVSSTAIARVACGAGLPAESETSAVTA